MQITQADISQIDELIRLRLDFLQELGDMPGETQAALRITLRAYLEKAMPAGNFAAFLAWDGGEVAATVYLSLSERIPSGTNVSGHQATVYNVFTYPAHRGRGLAKGLMAHSVAWARENGIEVVDLLATDMGAPVYRGLGFAEDKLLYMVLHALPGGGQHE